MKTDVYQEVTNQVVEMMETAGANWIKPFEALAGGMPMNATTGNEYRGINVLLLAMAGGQYWASFKQWQSDINHAVRGTKASGIAIERDHWLIGDAPEHLELMLCDGCAKRRDGTFKPRL